MVAAPRRIGLLSTLLALVIVGCTQIGAPRPDDETLPVRTELVTFVDCVFYSGATHFYFQRADGQELQVIQSNDEGSVRIANADLLLELDAVEGPPGPNQALVGRTVMLQYDKQGRIVEVSMVRE